MSQGSIAQRVCGGLRGSSTEKKKCLGLGPACVNRTRAPTARGYYLGQSDQVQVGDRNTIRVQKCQ